MSKPIYILGGMGPQASVELYRLLIEKAQRDYGAVHNDDYPELVIHSLPVPDFIGDERSKAQALGMLIKAVADMTPDRFSYFAIACNTIHLLASELTKHTKTPLVSMISEVAAVVANKGVKRVGLLATPTTIKSQLYQSALAEHDTAVVVPNNEDRRTVESAIRAVIAGESLVSHARQLRGVVARLQSKGATEIVLGCTELPLVFAHMPDTSVISSLDVLADSLLKQYKEQYHD